MKMVKMHQRLKILRNDAVQPLDSSSPSSYAVHNVLDGIYLEAFHYNQIKYKNTVYYEQIKLLYFWEILVAKWPLIRHKCGAFWIPILSWFYCIIVYIICLVTNALTVQDLLNSFMSNENDGLVGNQSEYDKTLLLVTFLLGVYWNVGAPIFDWTSAYKNVKFLNSWNNFQELYKNRVKDDLNLDYKIQINATAITVMFMNVIMILYGFENVVENLHWYSVVAITFACIDGAIFMLFWWYSCLILSETGRKLNKHLLLDLKNLNKINCKKIHDYRILWIELANLCELLCSILGNKVLAHMSIIYVSLVINCYQSITWLREPGGAGLKQYIAAIIYTWLALFCVCEAGDRVYMQVGEKFIDNIYSECNFLTLPTEERVEIESLLHVIQTRPPVIIICNFLDINRRLMFRIASATLTSIMILLQFKSKP